VRQVCFEVGHYPPHGSVVSEQDGPKYLHNDNRPFLGQRKVNFSNPATMNGEKSFAKFLSNPLTSLVVLVGSFSSKTTNLILMRSLFHIELTLKACRRPCQKTSLQVIIWSQNVTCLVDSISRICPYLINIMS